MGGAVGKVVEELDPEGVIKVRGGELWKAVSRDGGGRIPVGGERVKVVEVRGGLTLIVEKTEERRDD